MSSVGTMPTSYGVRRDAMTAISSFSSACGGGACVCVSVMGDTEDASASNLH